MDIGYGKLIDNVHKFKTFGLSYIIYHRKVCKGPIAAFLCPGWTLCQPIENPSTTLVLRNSDDEVLFSIRFSK